MKTKNVEPYSVFYDRKYNNKYNKIKGGRKKDGGKKRIKGTTKYHNYETWENCRKDKQVFSIGNNYLKTRKRDGETVLNNETFEHNVLYSLNKNRRWETVKQLKKSKEIPVFINRNNPRTMNGYTGINNMHKYTLENGKGKEHKLETIDNEIRANQHLQQKNKNKNGKKDLPQNLKKRNFKNYRDRSKRKKGDRNKRSKAPIKARHPTHSKDKGNVNKDDLHRVKDADEILVLDAPPKVTMTRHRNNRGVSPGYRLEYLDRMTGTKLNNRNKKNGKKMLVKQQLRENEKCKSAKRLPKN